MRNVLITIFPEFPEVGNSGNIEITEMRKAKTCGNT